MSDTTDSKEAGARLAGRFRKKPVVIEAVQWWKPGDHPEVVKMLATAEGEEAYSRQMEKAWGDFASVFYAVRTLEGNMRVSPGDWIITGIKGEHYPCKPDIFAATYEPVDESRALLAASTQEAGR